MREGEREDEVKHFTSWYECTQPKGGTHPSDTLSRVESQNHKKSSMRSKERGKLEKGNGFRRRGREDRRERSTQVG